MRNPQFPHAIIRRRRAELSIRHFLEHLEKEVAAPFFRLAQEATKVVEITSLFTRASPTGVVRRVTLQVVREFWGLFALVEELIEWDLQRARQLFQCFNSRDSVAILYTGNITTKQARSLFDVALGELLFYAHFAEAVSNNHGELLHPRMARASGNFCSPLVWDLFCAAQWYEYLVTDRIVNEFREGMQAKLEHDFRPVRLHCPDGNS